MTLVCCVLLMCTPFFACAQNALKDELICSVSNASNKYPDSSSVGMEPIKINHKIIASGDRQFYPYEYVNREGEPDGFDVELFRALMKNLHLDYDLTLGDLSQVHQLMKNEKIDVIVGVMYSPQRAKYIRFGIPHNIITLSFTVKNGSGFESSDNLKGKRIAVQKMDRGYDYLRETGFTDKIVAVNTIKEGFRMLESGDCDAVLFDHLSSLTMARDLKLKDTKIIASNIAPQRYSIGVNYKDEDLLFLLNEGLYEMKVSGEYDKIYDKWFNVTDHAGERYRRTISIVKFVLISLWVLLLLGAIFILVLKSKVKRSTKEILKERDRAERADKLKSVFLSNMSHEIRTPLNAIVGFAGLLCEEGQDIEDKKNYAEIIKCNSRQLLQLVSDILDTAKIESGTLVLNKNDFTIEDPCMEAFMSVKVNFTSENVILQEDYKCDCIVNADLLRIEQVIVNFLTNAIKFTKKGSITLSTICCPDSDTVEVSVTDTGIGISNEDANTVFDRFNQVDKMGRGAGLGLSISKNIIELSGGEIGVDSEEGKGSKFWFRLPIAGMSH